MTKKTKRWTGLALAVLLLTAACAAPTPETLAPEPTVQANREDEESGAPDVKTGLQMSLNGTRVAVEWAANDAVQALEMLTDHGPIRIELSPYGGFEQVGELGETLPGTPETITAQSGDVLLYNGDKIVLFYGENTWAYVRLGRITGLSAGELERILGGEGIGMTLEKGTKS